MILPRFRSSLEAALVLSWIGWVAVPHAATQEAAETQPNEFTIKTWQTEDGLPQNTVSSITQTQDGYLWLGTFNGLVRFDGVKFTTFTAANTSGMRNDNINVLYEDTDGRLWIGSEGGGLIRYENGSVTSMDPAGPAVILAISEDIHGTMWVGATSGLYRLAGTTLERTPLPRVTRQDDRVNSLCIDLDGWTWVNIGNEVFRKKDDSWERVPSITGNCRMTADLSTGIWLASSASGLVHIKQDAITRVGDIPKESLQQICQTSDGDIWITTIRKGIIRFSGGIRSDLRASDGLLVNDIPAIFQGREGNLWVGSNGGGLHRLRRRAIKTITTHDGLPHNDIVSLMQDASGRVWIGTWGEGGGVWSKGKWSRLSNLPGEGHIVYAHCLANDGSVFVGGTDGKLFRWKDGRVTDKEEIPGQGSRVIFEDAKRNLWLGSRDRGVQRRREDDVTHFRPADGLSHRYVTAIAEDHQGAIWIGTKHGLNRIVDEQIEQFHRADGLGAESIHTLFVDQQGTLWIGTAGGGLSRFRNGQFTTIDTRNGLVNDVVAQILEDDYGHIWIGSNAGLWRASRTELEACLDGKTSQIQGLALGRSDGMLNPECAGSFQPSCFKDPNGQLWFATVGGIVVVDPTQIAANLLPPPVHIEYVRTDHDIIEPLRGPDIRPPTIVIPPGENRIEIGYTALSYVAPERVRFRFRLEGWDKDWIEASTDRVAPYTKVTPGTYRFQVSACNNDGVWNDVGAAISLVIQPFWWQTNTFRISTALVLAGLALAGGQAVHRQKLRRILEIAEQANTKMRAEELGTINSELRTRTQQLESALANVKVLSGLIPICGSCKKIRDDKGYWRQVEEYVTQHSDAQFSHGLCPDCGKEFLNYPEPQHPDRSPTTSGPA